MRSGASSPSRSATRCGASPTKTRSPDGAPFSVSRPTAAGRRRCRSWDYAINDWVLSLSSYRKLLDEVAHDRVFVCGTGIDDGVRAALAAHDPLYYRARPIDEFRFIQKFDRIVQSNSSFCWWASLLSNATAVYTPRPDRGYLSKELAGEALDTGEKRYRLF